MKKLLLIILIMGCEDKGTEPPKWICTTDFNIEEGLNVPIPEDMIINWEQIGLFMIHNTIEECETDCPDSIEVTTEASPDGTGEYFIMYCTEN